MGESEAIGAQGASPERRFRVVLIVAAVVSALFAIPALLLAVQVLWLGALMLAIEAAIFAFFYYLARRYWIGLLFVPPLAFMVLGAAMGLLAFLPTSQVITLVK